MNFGRSLILIDAVALVGSVFFGRDIAMLMVISIAVGIIATKVVIAYREAKKEDE